ncbi:endo alpha-1,4 polygalactosaminidase [Kibdelosporangium persicum]|uniref:endo alpha-1,4 polygalactosaminidase n=1 Tax=Kibdelosporangium persicum TaxID=2698649 RepID=UPI001C274A84|nr:endo alpha-1,4 polygalactosaminidase [Kibdelosporangium persicum]
MNHPRGGPIAFYYGTDQIDRLAAFDRVVLQGDAYSEQDIASLVVRGVRPLCYLSMTEDTGPPAAWQRGDRNPDWGGHFVHVGHPGWSEHVLDQAEEMRRRGYRGFFLDTLNIELTFPEDLPHLLTLVAALRELTYPDYLLANRGFGLLPHLAELVDGVLFESFTSRWVEGGYAPWPPDVLDVHARYAETLLGLDVEVFALDYADTPRLAEFARQRAARFGMPCFVSTRDLTIIPAHPS